MTSDLRVSLPDHLQDSLKSLPDLLPTELRALVVQALEPPAKEIHYELLVKVSTWAHSEDGKERLNAADLRSYNTPPLWLWCHRSLTTSLQAQMIICSLRCWLGPRHRPRRVYHLLNRNQSHGRSRKTKSRRSERSPLW